MSSWRRSWARIALESQVCHCSKPQLSSKIGATSRVRSTKVGMMAWLSDHAFVHLQIFDYLFTCTISLVEIDVCSQRVGELCQSWPGQWWETYSQVHLRGNGWPSTAPASSPRWGGGVWRWMMEMNPDCICVSLMGIILAWGCHKTQAFPSNLYVDILTWMFVHWLYQLRGHCTLKVPIVGGTRFADDANTFIEQRP